MKNLKSFFLRFRFTAIGTLIGLALGYLYYANIGCDEGCTITGSPINSSLYGGLLGGLLLSMADDFMKKKSQ
jgi:TPP-dependent indolepyruvate ferredoxin oxidoreductase alpha subunit